MTHSRSSEQLIECKSIDHEEISQSLTSLNQCSKMFSVREILSFFAFCRFELLKTNGWKGISLQLVRIFTGQVLYSPVPISLVPLIRLVDSLKDLFSFNNQGTFWWFSRPSSLCGCFPKSIQPWQLYRWNLMICFRCLT